MRNTKMKIAFYTLHMAVKIPSVRERQFQMFIQEDSFFYFVHSFFFLFVFCICVLI